MTELSMEKVLEPLFEAMHTHQLTRVVARPGTVTGDGLGGVGTLELEWSDQLHQELMNLLEEPILLDNGASLEHVAGQIVVRMVPEPEGALAAMIEEGMLSEMAGSVLTAALVLGRNVVLTGPSQATVPLCVGLLGDGERPAVMGLGGMVAPQTWPHLSDLGEVQVLGPDRLGIWCAPAETLVEILFASSAVVGCLDGGRTDRALRRLENAMASVGMASPANRLTAGVDLIVTLAWNDGFRCQEIVEVMEGADECTTRAIFASEEEEGEPMLVPVGCPSFVEELRTLGLGRLADDLLFVGDSGGAGVSGGEVEARFIEPFEPLGVEPPDVALDPVTVEAPQVEVDVSRTMPRRPSYSPDSLDDDLGAPGWELEQISGELEIEEDAPAGSSDDSIMAATYGLAPPPRPQGVRTPEDPGFKRALEEAKVRDEAFRRMQDATTSEMED